MRLLCSRQGRVLLCFLAVLFASRPYLAGQDSDALLRAWIAQLGHPSYSSRQSAARALHAGGLEEWRLGKRVETGIHRDGRDLALESAAPSVVAWGPVTRALHQACSDESLEVRLSASRILLEIAASAQDEELADLLNPRGDPCSVRLAYWPEFSRWAGDDLPARTAFAAITARIGVPLFSRAGRRWEVDSLQRSVAQLDPLRISSDDTAAWMLLMVLDLERLESLRHLTPRLSTAMSRLPTGPAASTPDHPLVFGRLLDRWLGESTPLCGDRERLLIAMRYRRHEVARKLASDLLATEGTSAATTVTALLVASATDCDGFERQALRRADDHRVAIICAGVIANSPPLRIQVDDVALALLVHHRGFDPRNVGYRRLQADPLFRFHEESLGFCDDSARLDSRRQVAALLSE